MRNHTPWPGWIGALLVLVCLAGAALAGYQRIFSSFAVYDDEGYVMLSVRSFLQGRPLYEETYSQYGPAYYWVQWLIHRGTGWEITHDVTRLKSLGLWLTVSVLAMVFVYRVTSCRVASLLGFLLAFFHLERLSMEPGNPTGLCTLGTAICLVLATFVPVTGSSSWLFAAVGAVTSLVIMTKINVGVLLLAAVTLAMLVAMPKGRLRTMLLTAGIVFSGLVAGLLFRGQFTSIVVIPLPVVVLVALSSCLFVACRVVPFRNVSLQNLIWFWGTCGIASLAIAGMTLVHGTTPIGLLDGLVLQHRNFGSVFAGPYLRAPAVPVAALPLAALGALFAGYAIRGSGFAVQTVKAAMSVALVAVAWRHAAETWLPLVHGGQDRGLAKLLTSCLLPLAWVILLPRQTSAGDADGARTNQQFFARLTLCTIASLQPLVAFPCPGTQLATASLGILLVTLIGVADQFQSAATGVRWDWLIRRSPMIVVAAGALVILAVRGHYLSDARGRMEPLGFAGAERLRLPAAEVREKRWLVQQLRTHADTFVHLKHGYNSLYFWTELPPPTAWNATLWPQLFDRSRQEQILRTLLAHRKPCIVVPRYAFGGEKHGVGSQDALANPTDSPLVAYVNANFVPLFARGDVEIWGNPSQVPDDDTSSVPAPQSRPGRFGK